MFNLFSTIILGLTLLYFLQTSYAQQQNRNCVPSVCGNIRNISYPFRLRGDSRNCTVSDPSYELICENNTTTILHLYSQRYLVQSINYNNYTIRISDASVNNDTCSFPRYSMYFDVRYPMDDNPPYSLNYFDTTQGYYRLAQPATLLSCAQPVNRSSYINTSNCVVGDAASNSSSTSRYSYVKAGDMNVSSLGDMCSIHAVVTISIPYRDDDNITLRGFDSYLERVYNNITLPEFHSYVLYGFELSWFSALCDNCRGIGTCRWNGTQAVCRRYLGRDCNISSFYRVRCGGILVYLIDIADYIVRRINEQGYYILGVCLLRFIIGMPIMFGLLIYKFRRRHLSNYDVIEGFLQNQNNLTPIRYSYSEIKKMTKGFREKLGQGGFGSVYKGKLRSGRDVAVKVLSSKARKNGQDFMNEVATIGRIHHVNVVKLVGYTAELSKRALVYDFMPNGSLEKYILGKDRIKTLDWKKKYEIAVGVAHGIEYLHRGCDIQILHFDIKPHNILLDDNFTPKISDFGLAKFYPTDHNSVTLTAARGTIGYVAPELINRSIGNVSYKADVYSFGMMLMEMVGLKRDLVENPQESFMYFPYWIYNHLDKWKDVESGNIHEIAVNESSEDNDVGERTTRKMAIVALWCIQMNPGDRPPMSKVVEMLEGDVGSLQVPPQPAYKPQLVQGVEETWDSDFTDSMAMLSCDTSRCEH